MTNNLKIRFQTGIHSFHNKYLFATEFYRVVIGLCLLDSSLHRIFFSWQVLDMVTQAQFCHGSSTTCSFLLSLFFSARWKTICFEILLLVSTYLIIRRKWVRRNVILALAMNIILIKVLRPFVQGGEVILLYWLVPLLFIKFPVKRQIVNSMSDLPLGDLSTVLGICIARIQIILIYVMAGLGKLFEPDWATGRALEYVIHMKYQVVLNLSFLEWFPKVTQIMTFSIILFELGFPFLIWFTRFRPFLFFVGTFFHALCAIVLDIPALSLGSIASYFMFMPERQLRFGIEALRSVLKNTSWTLVKKQENHM